MLNDKYSIYYLLLIILCVTILQRSGQEIFYIDLNKEFSLTDVEEVIFIGLIAL